MDKVATSYLPNIYNSVMGIAYVTIQPCFSSFSVWNCKPKTTNLQVRCTYNDPKWRGRRQMVSIAFLLSNLLTVPNHAAAGSVFDKYLKRKKLDPLESYIPAVILTQLQIDDLEKNLDVEKPQFATCRSLLRSGPLSSFRVNIRAVAQYATDAGTGNTASDDVDQCLRALEELDSLLLRASRNDQQASFDEMKKQINVAVNSLNRLLKTVPMDVLERGKAAADGYRRAREYPKEESSADPELKQLESIL